VGGVYYLDEIYDNEKYTRLIEYALETSDFFMFVFCKKKNEGFKRSMLEIKKKLSYLNVKAQYRYSWVGTETIPGGNYEHQVCFYRADVSAMQCLLSVNSLFEWIWPLLPQDLCFFREDRCWFCSTSHERLAVITEPTHQDVEFFKQLSNDAGSMYYSDTKWDAEEASLRGLRMC